MLKKNGGRPNCAASRAVLCTPQSEGKQDHNGDPCPGGKKRPEQKTGGHRFAEPGAKVSKRDELRIESWAPGYTSPRQRQFAVPKMHFAMRRGGP